MPPSNNPNQNLPHLTTTLAHTIPEEITSLHLISDSIAQQRQTASRAILFHPLTLTLLTLTILLLSQHLYQTPPDWPLLLTTSTGSIATILLFTRYTTRGYLDEAERIGTWRWLYSNNHQSNSNPPPSHHQYRTSKDPETSARDRDLILISKFGDKIIGTLVLRAVDTLSELDEHVSIPERTKMGVLEAGTTVGVIRAWTGEGVAGAGFFGETCEFEGVWVGSWEWGDEGEG
ncbi:hypothetical protein BDV32DRAFT_149530 [Aspergillus pseudonomiae]|uniref:Uncharacterized protein n=1 Tax=Aspergillus pseudonomiae TaxID=1506151 RepID=A0A5N6I2C9_9EURO|nr:uncharacterized protein BDV37DRAFT_284821 [Aspergillus pseudonomiae]KAB8260304.1 hypothetical protein BDV32DRAFT_149530 [Aspergillus pseudonomiae]KAE8402340.1 hypothetical protein BDV37DRAFT_284821 [Aspergillus pseudonomiae]